VSTLEEPLGADFEDLRIIRPKTGRRPPMLALALGVAVIVFIGVFCAICAGAALGVALLAMS